MNQQSSTVFQGRFRPTLRLAAAMRRWHGAALLIGVITLSGCATSAVSSHNACVQGVDLFHQGNYDQAAVRFQQALNEEPNNPDALYDMGAVYHQLWIVGRNPGDAARSEQYYRDALARDPNMGDAYRAIAVLMTMQGRQEEALKTLQGWAVRDQKSAAPRLELARLCEEQNAPEAAMLYLEDVIKADPENARALAAIGRLREKAGEPNAAIHYYARAAERSDSPELRNHIASLRNSAGAGSQNENPYAAMQYTAGNDQMFAQNGYNAGAGYDPGYGAYPTAGNANPTGNGSENRGLFSRLSGLFPSASGTPENRSYRSPAFFTQPVPGYAPPQGYTAQGEAYYPSTFHGVPAAPTPYADPAMVSGVPMGMESSAGGYPAGYPNSHPAGYPNGSYPVTGMYGGTAY